MRFLARTKADAAGFINNNATGNLFKMASLGDGSFEIECQPNRGQLDGYLAHRILKELAGQSLAWELLPASEPVIEDDNLVLLQDGFQTGIAIQVSDAEHCYPFFWDFETQTGEYCANKAMPLTEAMRHCKLVLAKERKDEIAKNLTFKKKVGEI